MLHAFDAGADGGKPLFAYLPEALTASWPELANRRSTEAATDGRWHADDQRRAPVPAGPVFCFAPLGRGKAIVALDVTDPAVFADETKADKVFRWQFASKDRSCRPRHIVAEANPQPIHPPSGPRSHR